MKKDFKYIYGPVPSWRLGSSLGIDLLSQDRKICNFDCLYCQLGNNLKYTTERKIYVLTNEVLDEIKLLPDVKIDYFTFSGRGEPTLAKNFGEVIESLKKIGRGPIAVLTNASLINREDAREELAKADFVSLKLDAYSKESFNRINRPAPTLEFSSIIEGMKKFRNEFKGKLALQIMFIDENKDHVNEFIDLAKKIKPDEIQVNTPLRESKIKPLSKDVIANIKKQFEVLDVDVVSVYEAERKKVKSISKEDTLRRRGKK